MFTSELLPEVKSQGEIFFIFPEWKLAFCFPVANFVAVVQLLSRVRLFATPWTAACQASLSFPISQSLLKLMPIELMMLSHHLILCRPLLMPSIFPSTTYSHNFSRNSALQALFSYLKTNKQMLCQSLWIFSVSFSPCFILFSAFP